MDPVTSPLIHKDSGRRARVDPGEKNPSQLATTLRNNGTFGSCVNCRADAHDADVELISVELEKQVAGCGQMVGR